MATFIANQPVNLDAGFELFDAFRDVTPGSIQNTTPTGFDVVGATTTAHVEGSFDYSTGSPNGGITAVRVFANAAPAVDLYNLTRSANDDLFRAIGLSTLQGYAASAQAALVGLARLFGGPDTITATAALGNDVLAGFDGDDSIDAGPGIDTVVFRGPVTDYSFGLDPNGALVVTDIRASNFATAADPSPRRDGVDTVSNAEIVTFSDFAFLTSSIKPGGDAADILAGGPDTAIFDGGGGVNTLNYTALGTTALYIDLVLALAVKGGSADFMHNIQNVTGAAGGDAIVGDGSGNLLDGGAGDDFLFGTSFGTPGPFLPGSGNDSLNGGDGDDGLWGADGNDVLDGGPGNDRLTGGEGADSLAGGDGDDQLFGAEFGSTGAVLQFSEPDSLSGGAGNDILFGFAGNDDLAGDAGDDVILAGSGDDLVTGGDGNDNILGEGGHDTINGGAGFDFLTGGIDGHNPANPGGDTFDFRKGDGYDVILDFELDQLSPNAAIDVIRLDPALGVTSIDQLKTLAQADPDIAGAQLNGVRIDFSSVSGTPDQLALVDITLAAFNNFVAGFVVFA